MSEHEGGPATGPDEASEPTKEELGPEAGAPSGDPPRKGGKPSPGERGAGDTGLDDDQAPIDLDSAHDRAS